MIIKTTNRYIKTKIKEVDILRQSNKPSLPSILGIEMKINPFMRCREETIIEAAELYASKKLNSTAEVLGEIRNWKDNF